MATSTAYDAALALASDSEKERLQALRLRLNIPPDSPEWGFYAVLAPLTTSTIPADLDARLRSIEAAVRSGAAPSEGSNLLFRDLLAVLLAVLAIVAVATIAARFGPPLVVIAAFGLGIGATLGYVWAAPLVSAAIRR